MNPEHVARVRNYRPLTELVPPHWQSADVTAADGTRLHYTRSGGAHLPLILLHGIQVNGLSWLRTALALADEFDVILPDARGHGLTGGLDQPFTPETPVQDVQALIQALALAKPVVVGHSLGADTAGWLAVAQPLRAIVLVDPALRPFPVAHLLEQDPPPPWIKSLLATIAALKTQTHTERMVTGLHLLPPGAEPWDELDYVSFVEGQGQFDPAFYQLVGHLPHLFAAPEAIARIPCPILLLTARPMMPGSKYDDGLAAFEDHWQNGQHVHFDNSGHFIQADQFDRFMQVLRAFLAEQT